MLSNMAIKTVGYFANTLLIEHCSEMNSAGVVTSSVNVPPPLNTDQLIGWAIAMMQLSKTNNHELIPEAVTSSVLQMTGIEPQIATMLFTSELADLTYVDARTFLKNHLEKMEDADALAAWKKELNDIRTGIINEIINPEQAQYRKLITFLSEQAYDSLRDNGFLVKDCQLVHKSNLRQASAYNARLVAYLACQAHSKANVLAIQTAYDLNQNISDQGCFSHPKFSELDSRRLWDDSSTMDSTILSVVRLTDSSCRTIELNTAAVYMQQLFEPVQVEIGENNDTYELTTGRFLLRVLMDDLSNKCILDLVDVEAKLAAENAERAWYGMKQDEIQDNAPEPAALKCVVESLGTEPDTIKIRELLDNAGVTLVRTPVGYDVSELVQVSAGTDLSPLYGKIGYLETTEDPDLFELSLISSPVREEMVLPPYRGKLGYAEIRRMFERRGANVIPTEPDMEIIPENIQRITVMVEGHQSPLYQHTLISEQFSGCTVSLVEITAPEFYENRKYQQVAVYVHQYRETKNGK